MKPVSGKLPGCPKTTLPAYVDVPTGSSSVRTTARFSRFWTTLFTSVMSSGGSDWSLLDPTPITNVCAVLTNVLFATRGRLTWKYRFRGESSTPCTIDRAAE